ncbi:alanine/glycine:cation symporter family protein [Nesterenkonia haasae]|uniref:alanine/glycine:cation symporter family protein n=1 Tax=Nesterenkonia haasae TaxID=2587813 RepID=UPI001390764B|nr:alanine/glycine:cation symporter family protein [Nesterenkonia haasae]NDK31120.1 alanine:cation symporter family protein [Nesterenkonia haasae]
MDSLVEMLEAVEDPAWQFVGIPVITAVAIYLMVRTRLVQLRHIPNMFRSITQRAQRDSGGRTRSLSAFQAFAVTASARVGTGNIAGVSGAIAMGGAGAVFWMWVMALFTASASFVESTLAQLYKTRRFDTFKGGPAYYIQRGLGSRSLGMAFAVVFIFCFALSFTSLQANTIVDTVTGAAETAGMTDTGPLTWALALLLVILTGIVVIFGGLRKVAQVAQNVVPLMAALYLVLGVVVVIVNIDQLPGAVAAIFGEAFDFRAIAGGAFWAMIVAGVQRGMLSNEAGMGSVPNVAATADVSHPVKQGLVQTLGVYFDTWLICSITASIILVTYPDPAAAEANVGAELTQGALEETFGLFGAIALALIIFLVAFTSILGNYSYGEANVLFISDSEKLRKVFAVVLTGVVFIGATIEVDLAWAIAGVAMVVIALFNLVVITILAPTALKLLRHYEDQRKRGLQPVFTDTDLPELEDVECWGLEDVQYYLDERAAEKT